MRRLDWIPPTARAVMLKLVPALGWGLLYAGRNGAHRPAERLAVSVSFDLDLDADIASLPMVLEALRDRNVRATFACIGAYVEQYPREHAAILAEGHEVMNHGYQLHHEIRGGTPVAHRFYHEMPKEEIERDIHRGHDALVQGLGHEPAGFRVPHFATMNWPQVRDWVFPVLKAAGYRYSSSTTAINAPYGGRCFEWDGISEFPLLTCPEHPRSVLDSWHCETLPGHPHSPQTFLPLFRRALELSCGFGERTYVNIYLDPSRVTRELLTGILDTALQTVRPSRFRTYRDLAEGRP
jgi:peptidoglycan/xylan/chitin deacetylase (PgdA/CDA1 family)